MWQARFREGAGAPGLLVAHGAGGGLMPLAGPLAVADVEEGGNTRVVVHVAVDRPGQVQLAAQLTCTLNPTSPVRCPKSSACPLNPEGLWANIFGAMPRKQRCTGIEAGVLARPGRSAL